VGHIESNLIPGEQVLYKTGLHWVVAAGAMVCGAIFGLFGLLILIGGAAASSGGMAGMGIFLLVFGGLVAFLGHLQRKATEMAVTNRRIVIKTGLVSRKTFEMLTSKVESIGVEEGLFGRMLGYGTVVVRGTGGTPEPFRNVAHPLEFRRQVQQQIEHREQQMTRSESTRNRIEETITA
jgi:uncharacterized membrane protein YdbT with pleckstrin-like domain